MFAVLSARLLILSSSIFGENSWILWKVTGRHILKEGECVTVSSFHEWSYTSFLNRFNAVRVCLGNSDVIVVV